VNNYILYFIPLHFNNPEDCFIIQM